MPSVYVRTGLLPSGHIYIVENSAEAEDVEIIDQQVSQAVVEAFHESNAAGIICLASRLLTVELPSRLAFWRELGRLFMTQVCALSDLEQARERFILVIPRQELEQLLVKAVPMPGGEYLNAEILGTLWQSLHDYVRKRLQEFQGTAQEFLQALNPLWNLVGRICFHLAENKQDEHKPFAFLATYTTQLSRQARAQHVPLGRALEEFSGMQNKQALLALLVPVQKAAGLSASLKSMVETGEIFHPLAWTPQEAYQFLQEIPIYEAAGIVVRVPDWWKAKRRPQVKVTLGQKQPQTVMGLDSLVDFSMHVCLGDDSISDAELLAMMRQTEGLIRMKGQWVEINNEQLQQVLEHWQKVQGNIAHEGISFGEAMRLLAGAHNISERDAAPVQAHEWSQVVAGGWLEKTLDALRSPEFAHSMELGDALKATLRPYQQHGVAWLWFLHTLRLGACLADDMGLGKTIQMLAFFLLLKKSKPLSRSLLVLPASLIGNWLAEIDRFAPSLKVTVVHPSLREEDVNALTVNSISGYDLVITTYGFVMRLVWLKETFWDVVVIDEAQAIKNPHAKQTLALKALQSGHRVALTGTPVENRLEDIWSLFDFICPGLLGSVKEFQKFTKQSTQGIPKSIPQSSNDTQNSYGPLRNLVKPYILRRLKTDKHIIADLPDKTEVRAYCYLSKIQAALYEQAVGELSLKIDQVEGIARRGVILAFLTRFKQICNHPSQWLGDGHFQAADSGKFQRLAEVCTEIAAKQEKVLVFTQYREITGFLAEFLATVFKAKGLVLHGETKVKERKKLVDAFQDEAGPPFFVLSLKAGGVGLNLTAASHVVHFDRWWNPAVENQATDRAFRIGQKRHVLVHKFVCRGTIEEKVDALIETKKALSQKILEGGGGIALTEMSNADLLKLVSLDVKSALAEAA